MIFVQYGQIDVLDGAFVVIDQNGVRTHIPVGSVACIMLEPGTRISHAAVTWLQLLARYWYGLEKRVSVSMPAASPVVLARTGCSIKRSWRWMMTFDSKLSAKCTKSGFRSLVPNGEAWSS